MKNKVMFRKFKDGDVIALFPEMLGNYHPYTCGSYRHFGHRGSTSVNIIQCTKPAKQEEYAGLKKELELIGYELEIVKRLTAKSTQVRKSQV